jgi:peptidylprolyl isomerase domain and WD repeat-containing protein 1
MLLTDIGHRSTGFIITTSVDGHVKFWKKKDVGIEFVKHFKAHLGNESTAAE